jgi:hypothetical protein
MFKERVLKKGPWYEGEDANNMWMKMFTFLTKKVSLALFKAQSSVHPVHV